VVSVSPTITRTATEMASKSTISPKTILAAVLPTLGGILAVGIQWAVTGELDKPELITALTAFGSALVAGLGAYLGEPGQVVVNE
jgi:hypothetical protein